MADKSGPPCVPEGTNFNDERRAGLAAWRTSRYVDSVTDLCSAGDQRLHGTFTIVGAVWTLRKASQEGKRDREADREADSEADEREGGRERGRERDSESGTQ
eukprot:2689262-Pleurochrysis_carterae.AAC.1